MTAEPERPAVRAALALASGCVVAVALYALLRVGQAIFTREPNPALVIWSAHAGYFWRSLTVAYVGGMTAILAWTAARRDAARVARFAARGVVAAAALIALQAALVP